MNKNNYFLALILTLFSFSSVSASKYPPLTWGYIDFKPYHYTLNNVPHGLLVEKVNALFKKADLDYSSIKLPSKRVQVYIEQNQVDFATVIESFIKTPESFIKSEFPIFKITLGAICTDSSIKINRVDDLKNFRLILLAGYSYGQDSLINKRNGFNIVSSTQDHYSAIQALIYNRGDCVLGYLQPFLVEKEKYSGIDLTFNKLDEFPVYLYLRKEVNHAESIMKAINQHF